MRQLGHLGQEQARLGALDDAVVVGGGEGHDLADAELGDDLGVGRLEPGRVAKRPDADDRPLAGHEPGHRLHGPERARVGEGDGGAGEVVGADLAGVHLAHQLLVGEHEGPEVEGVGVLDARHQQGARAVGLLDVDGQAEPDVRVAAPRPGVPLAVDVGHEGRVERRDVGQRPDDGVADEVGEADLGPGGPGQLVVEDLPVDLEQLGRHGADAGGGGHRQAGLHVGDDAGGRPAQRHRRLGRPKSTSGAWSGRRTGAGDGADAAATSGRPVAGPAPAPVGRRSGPPLVGGGRVQRWRRRRHHVGGAGSGR